MNLRRAVFGAQVRVNAEALASLDARGGLFPLFEGTAGLTKKQRRIVVGVNRERRESVSEVLWPLTALIWTMSHDQVMLKRRESIGRHGRRHRGSGSPDTRNRLCRI